MSEISSKILMKRVPIWLLIFSIIGIIFPIQTLAISLEIPEIIPRSEWLDRPDLINLMKWFPEEGEIPPDYQPVERIVIHHSVTPAERLVKYSPKIIIQNIFRYHAVTKGWGDIGYNYIIDQKGNIYQGRYGGNGARGAHVYDKKTKNNYNLGTIGIGILGNYEEREFPQAAKNSLEKLMGWLAAINNFNPGQLSKTTKVWNSETESFSSSFQGPVILGHKDLGNTKCPGKNLYKLLPQIRNSSQTLANSYKKYGYQISGSNKVYFLTNGIKKEYKNFQALQKENKTVAKLVKISEEQLNLFSKKYLKYPSGSLVQGKGDLSVFYIEDGQKRLLDVSSSQFEKLGFNWEEIIPLEKEELNFYPDSLEIKYGPDGKLFRDLDGKVYLIDQGKKHWITSLSLFKVLGFRWSKVKDEEELKHYLLGSIATYPEGTLIKAKDDPSVYLLGSVAVQTKVIIRKKKILSEKLFDLLKFSWRKVIETTKEELNLYPEGEPVSYPELTLLKKEKEETVYLLKDGKLRPFSSEQLFKKLGYQWKNIIEIAVPEFSEYEIGESMKYPEGTLVSQKGDNKIYVIKNRNLEWIPTMKEFEKRAYRWDEVIEVSAEEIALYSATSNQRPATSEEKEETESKEQEIRIGIYSPVIEKEIKITANNSYKTCDLKNICIQRNKEEISSFIASTSLFAKLVGDEKDTIFEIISYSDPNWKFGSSEYNPEKDNYNKFRGKIEIKYSLFSKKVWLINELSLEDYLKGIAESVEGDTLEYLKSMAVAQRSYAFFHLNQEGKYGSEEIFHLKNLATDQLYKGFNREKYAPSIVKAQEETLGLVATFNNKPIRAVYSSGAAGPTKNGCDVFNLCGSDYQYLKGGINDPAGTEYQYLSCGGANHCVGVDSAGARKMAELGKTFEEILTLYYPGIKIEKLY